MYFCDTMIRENLQKIQQTIPDGVLLLAVSKTKPENDIMEAYEFGCRNFGENKAQEACESCEHENTKFLQTAQCAHL